ncbi:hypothetical protein Bbelb_168200 [Branchiostoma belcheri]|nr:hypothetical protein Bbelb_168200 [Branchiostoma belcheri]
MSVHVERTNGQVNWSRLECRDGAGTYGSDTFEHSRTYRQNGLAAPVCTKARQEQRAALLELQCRHVCGNTNTLFPPRGDNPSSSQAQTLNNYRSRSGESPCCYDGRTVDDAPTRRSLCALSALSLCSLSDRHPWRSHGDGMSWFKTVAEVTALMALSARTLCTPMAIFLLSLHAMAKSQRERGESAVLVEWET